ncbi:MAG: hypothetical protein ACSLEN_00245 [Candidatus Malihini olakiniferum]
MDVFKTGRMMNIASLPPGSNLGKVNEAILAKTHISQVKKKAVDQLTQQSAREIIADDISVQNQSLTDELPIILQSSPLTSKAQMLLLITQYQEITSVMDATQRANALAVFVTQSEVRMKKVRELSAHLDELHQTFDGLESKFIVVQNAVDNAVNDVAQAQRKLDEAQNFLADMLEQLGITDPDDPSIA